MRVQGQLHEDLQVKENTLSEKSGLESVEVQMKNACVSLQLPCEQLVSPTPRRNQLLVGYAAIGFEFCRYGKIKYKHI